MNGAKSGGGGALLDEYVSSVRVTFSDAGQLPKDLSGSAAATTVDQDPSIAKASNEAPGAAFTELGFADATADSFCLLHRQRLDPDDKTPADELLKADQDKLAASPIWIVAVDSLDQLHGKAPWPPPAGAVQPSTVRLLGDENVTITSRVDAGGGDYVEHKHDYRVVSLTLCGARPAITPTSRFLVAVNHGDPKVDGLEPHQWDDEQNKRSRMSRDVMLVWGLVGEGEKVDLGK